MKRTIIFLMCLLTSACVLSSCSGQKTNIQQTGSALPAAEAAAEQPPEPKPSAEPVPVPEPSPSLPKTDPSVIQTEITDGLNASELLRIRFTATQPASAEHIDEFYSSMTEDSVVSGKAEIPGGLTDALRKAIDDGTADKFVSEHSTGTELTLEEMLEATGTDPICVWAAMSFLADIDNDGTDDIISHMWGGGTGGFADITLFSGSSGFRQTASVSDIYYRTAVLRWDGKNYLCVEEYNYSTKQWLGYTVYAFAEGNVAAITEVCKKITGYTSEIISSDNSYPGIGQITASLSNDKMPSVLEYNNGIIYGTAEAAGGDLTEFHADINNDGTAECYTKYMYFPSNTGTMQRCIWYFEGYEADNDPITILANRDENSDSGQLYTFWIDDVNGDNILYMYFSGDYGFELCAYKLSA